MKDPTFDVYVGKKDHVIRKVSGRIDFEVPEGSRQELGGIEGGSLEFSVEFADVNGEQEIEAPAEARPLSELTGVLGGASLLGARPAIRPRTSWAVARQRRERRQRHRRRARRAERHRHLAERP